MVRPESLETASSKESPASLRPSPNSRIPRSPASVSGVSDQPCARPMVLNMVFP